MDKYVAWATASSNDVHVAGSLMFPYVAGPANVLQLLEETVAVACALVAQCL